MPFSLGGSGGRTWSDMHTCIPAPPQVEEEEESTCMQFLTSAQYTRSSQKSKSDPNILYFGLLWLSPYREQAHPRGGGEGVIIFRELDVLAIANRGASIFTELDVLPIAGPAYSENLTFSPSPIAGASVFRELDVLEIRSFEVLEILGPGSIQEVEVLAIAAQT